MAVLVYTTSPYLYTTIYTHKEYSFEGVCETHVIPTLARVEVGLRTALRATISPGPPGPPGLAGPPGPVMVSQKARSHSVVQ